MKTYVGQRWVPRGAGRGSVIRGGRGFRFVPAAVFGPDANGGTPQAPQWVDVRFCVDDDQNSLLSVRSGEWVALDFQTLEVLAISGTTELQVDVTVAEKPGEVAGGGVDVRPEAQGAGGGVAPPVGLALSAYDAGLLEMRAPLGANGTGDGLTAALAVAGAGAIGADGSGHGLTTQRRGRQLIISEPGPTTETASDVELFPGTNCAAFENIDSWIFIAAFVGGTSPTVSCGSRFTSYLGIVSNYLLSSGALSVSGGAWGGRPAGPTVDLYAEASGSPTSWTWQDAEIEGQP